MEVLLGKFLTALIIPPGLNLSLVAFGMLLRHRFYRTGIAFIYFGVILLYLFSTQLVSQQLATSINTELALDISTIASSKARAIVILGGGRYNNAPEYQADTVSTSTLERLRYGAYLQRKSKLPVVVSGGAVFGEPTAEAALMKKVLEDAFLSVAHWVEDKSLTTYQNAIYTYELLNKENIQDIILVTHALHMGRSKEAFEQAGFRVTPAPLGFNTLTNGPWYSKIMPGATALKTSSRVLHELIGRAWYKLRYY